MPQALIEPYRIPSPASVPVTHRAFLEALAGPRYFVIPGGDRSRCRAVVTLLHGNEPSGTLALQRLLREGFRPAVDLLCCVVNVAAALADPPARALPDTRDQNRAFCSPGEDRPGRLARALLDLLEAHSPELLLDLHNTSGAGPAYGVAIANEPVHRALSSLFGGHMMKTGLKLGTLIEGSAAICPSVTIECGGLDQPEAHETAYQGLKRYADGTPLTTPRRRVEVHHHPVRVELTDGSRVAYAQAPAPAVDVTLRPDVDAHNFTTLPAGFPVAWLGPRGMAALRVRGEDDTDRTAEFFRQEGGMLLARVPLKPLMVTTNAAIAASDCLFYAVLAEEEHRTTFPARSTRGGVL